MSWIDIGFTLFITVAFTSIIVSNIKWNNERNVLDEKYNVSKFPVTSLMGNLYYAEIVYNHESIPWYQFNCNVYTRTLKKNGKIKDKLILRTGVELEKFEYDYIKIVTSVIRVYETEHETEFKRKKQEEEAVSVNKKMFNEWDGVIKEEQLNKTK